MSDVTIILGKGGLLLFTAGLLIGAAIPRFVNSRMGLSAHLTAVQTGTALIAFGLFWPYFEITQTLSRILAYSLLSSSYVLVVGLIIAAIFGASANLPIAGKGFQSSPAKELIVSILVFSSSGLMAITCVGICLFAVVL